MANKYGQSFFGDIESRLTRGLDLSGQIGTTPELEKPLAVIMAQDFSGLGYAGNLRGRQWYSRLTRAGGVNAAQVFFRFNVDCLIEAIVASVSNGGAAPGLQIRVYGPNDVGAATPTNGNGVFFDHCLSVSEIPPVVAQGLDAVASGGSTLFSRNLAAGAATDVEAAVPTQGLFPMVMAAGSGISFDGLIATTSIQVCLRGRCL